MNDMRKKRQEFILFLGLMGSSFLFTYLLYLLHNMKFLK